MSNNEFLETMREYDKVNKQDKEEYLEKCREFATFVESGVCKVQEGEDDEQ